MRWIIWREESFYTLKFAERFAVTEYYIHIQATENTFLHPYQTAEIFLCEGEKSRIS